MFEQFCFQRLLVVGGCDFLFQGDDTEPVLCARRFPLTCAEAFGLVKAASPLVIVVPFLSEALALFLFN